MKQSTTCLSLKNVNYMTFYYEDRLGQYKRSKKPLGPTIFNEDCPPSQLHNAILSGWLDEWIPTLVVTFSNANTLVYKRARALALWDAWRAKQYAKKGKD